MHGEIDAVEDFVRESVLALGPVAADRVIKVSVTETGHAVVYADPGRLRQVIDNLLGNAIKFNRDGGAVDVTVSTDGEATTIAVRDTTWASPPTRSTSSSDSSARRRTSPATGSASRSAPTSSRRTTARSRSPRSGCRVDLSHRAPRAR